MVTKTVQVIELSATKIG